MVNNEEARKIILEMVEKIKKEYQPEKIILFGSFAYGSPDRDSDIDLLIVKDTSERPIDRRTLVRKMVSNPERMIPFEPIVLTPGEIAARIEIGDQFVKEILQKGEILYGA